MGLSSAALIFLAVLITATGCQQSQPGGGTSSCPEVNYCPSSQNYSGGVTITGQAKFERRISDNNGLEGPDPTLYPIRYAEVSINDRLSGRQLNCGETDTNGNFSLTVPPNRIYNVSVRSRSLNNTAKVSVLDSPSTCNAYSVVTSLTAGSGGTSVNATPTGTELVARVASSQGILGGAFNIHSVIVKANENLRNMICGSPTSTCANFSVAPKVNVFWKPGFNPGTYVGVSSGLSFYMPGKSELYILGGVNGDTASSDTDHFDDGVIGHEFTHFLIDQFSSTDSPGGSHSNNQVGDPRLVWDEGFANFLSEFLRQSNMYRDSYGNSDKGASHTGNFFNIDMEADTTTDPGLSSAAADQGEGNFREFAISKALYDGVDTATSPDNSPGVDDDTAASSFANYWSLLIGTWKTGQHFRNVGLFFSKYFSTFGADAGLSAALAFATAQIDPNTKATFYAKPLPLPAGSGTQTIYPRDAVTSGSFADSNKFYSNHFWSFFHDGTYGKINLNPGAVTGTAPDLDLFLFPENFFYDSSAIPSPISKASATAGSTECVNLAGLATGYYIMDVFADTSGGGNNTVSPYTANGISYQLVPGAGTCP